MLKKLVFLFFVITAVSSVQQSDIPSTQNNDVEPDPEMEKYLREALENFREQMKEGLPAINMPRLDPLDLRNLDVNVNEHMATMSLRVKEVSVRSLSLFNITDLKTSLEHLYLSINLTFPELYVNGNYNLDGKFVKIFPIYGSGRFEINATEICIAGRGRLHFFNSTLEMGLMKLDLSWHAISVFLENFLGGGDFSEVLQRLVPDVGKDVFLAYKPLILEKLEDALTREINMKLTDPMIRNIIEGIHPDEYFE